MRRLILAAALGLMACGRGTPRPIAYGAEACTHCHMTISDPRFVAEAVLRTGKVLAFDDIGCLAQWLAGEPRATRAVWVVAFVGQEWLPAAEAVYLRTDSLRTPMASGLIAAKSAAEADSLAASLGGQVLAWEAVVRMPSPHGAAHTP